VSAALDLLVRLHNDGIRLWAVSGEELEYEGPQDLVTGEVVEDLRRHKADLLDLLEWDQEVADALVRAALAYLEEYHVEGLNLSALGPSGNRIDEAYAREDMGALRAAVREFVRAGLASFAGGDDA
jgi:hypothetical protein